MEARPMRGCPKACQRERSFTFSGAAKLLAREPGVAWGLHPETAHLRIKPTPREQRDGERHCLAPWIKLYLKPNAPPCFPDMNT